MTDDTARFAAKLARSVGRLDFWNVYAEHTPHQWKVQQILYSIEPFGEDRADLRTAVATARLIAMNASEPISDAEYKQEVDNIRFYLKVNQPKEDVLSPAQAAALLG